MFICQLLTGDSCKLLYFIATAIFSQLNAGYENKVGHGGLMVGVLNSVASDPGFSPGRGHCIVTLDKTLYSHSALLHPGV